MSKEVEFKNRDRFIQLGIAIAALRKMRGMSQEKLAELSNVSRSHISANINSYPCSHIYTSYNSSEKNTRVKYMGQKVQRDFEP